MPETSPHNLLPLTLAERIRFLREQRLLTIPLLAHKVHLSSRQIEDIESGIELFLSPAIRARLAGALHVTPACIKAVEKIPDGVAPSLDSATSRSESLSLYEAILIDPEANHDCPECCAQLRVQTFERRDFNDKPLLVIKVHCSQCLFRLTDD
jgi:transcriptional regulator with XRE-family HTH domain